MTYLKYTGKTLAEVGVVPLPEGWSAADHDEPDKAIAKEKLASGFYERGKASEAEGEPVPSAESPAEEPAEVPDK